ncbi:anti-sigma factor family protein [Humisphaera borealis]|uniref:Zf-HC2 domain-containing protein n=1 Tax=Humisphaera borealis TaxID=2807512 RepID=A0A7M2WYV6_9BACT|nr:zf-HC2 domain-containing protein [Humisphaera borealis]QOV90688.1 zf-HC2 domain-containing protein [Humisphaera borealis]
MSDTPKTPSPNPTCSQSGGPVSCRDCADFLMDYLDGLLPESERLKFDAHLALCRDCRVYMENYRKTVEATCRCPEAKAHCQTPEMNLPARLVQAILAARRSQ